MLRQTACNESAGRKDVRESGMKENQVKTGGRRERGEVVVGVCKETGEGRGN
jgi:hypothetical protein